MRSSEDEDPASWIERALGEHERERGSLGFAPGDFNRTTPQEAALGYLAVREGLVRAEHVKEGLRLQEEARAQGRELLLGEILIERKYLKSEDLPRLIEAQKSREDFPKIPRYEFQGRLGEGATAVVYRAYDRDLKRPVAIKVLREQAALSETARQRFRREAAAAAGLDHPNLVKVHDTGETDGRLYIVMELVEGRPLSEILKEGKCGEAELVRILEEAARGLGAAHEKGIVHRDLKPANILVALDGAPKVGDFGLAHLPESKTLLTKTGTALGTPLYMSPEQVEGRPKEITARTDVYALGAILYEILTSRTPHAGETIAEIYSKIVREEPMPPRKLRATVSRDLETIALKSLERDPRKRYPSALEFGEELRRSREGEPIAARPISSAERLWRRAVRYRAILLPSVLAVILGILVGISVSKKTVFPEYTPASAPVRVPSSVVFLEGMEGEVHLLREGRKTPARQGQILTENEGLETGAWPSSGLLRFQNGSRVELGPDTSVRRLAAGLKERISVDKGTVRAELADSHNTERIEIETPQTTLRGGEVLRIIVGSTENPGTRIEVEMGKVELWIAGVNTLTLESGHYALVTPGVKPVPRPLALSLDLGSGVTLEMVYIKAGSFTMGGKMAPTGRSSHVDERPEHRVTLSKGYYLGTYPVTRGQFAAFVRETGHVTKAEHFGKAGGRTAAGQWQDAIPGNNWRTPATFLQTDDHPVTCVSWDDAQAFCRWSSKRTGRLIRLPTEAEWEYACKAGTTTRWSFGDDRSMIGEYAWIAENAAFQTHPIGQKKPNAWGLYDMHGNVWEWCLDWAGPYTAKDALDPPGPETGDHRVLRGGGWNSSDVMYTGSATRRGNEPYASATFFGFRVAVP